MAIGLYVKHKTGGAKKPPTPKIKRKEKEMETTRKQLKLEAERLNAEKVAGNIYDYENYLHGKNHKCIAYSHGLYGNNGRLDYLETEARFVYY